MLEMHSNFKLAVILSLHTRLAPRRLLATLAVVLATGLPAGLPEARAEGPLAEVIPGLIKDLNADEFAARQEATRRLRALGEAAIKPLAEAAKQGSFEVRSRAMGILETHFRDGSSQLKSAAEAALRELAANSDTTAGKLAGNVLRPAPTPQNPFQRGGGIQIARAALPVRPGGFNRTIRAVVDGKKITINITPNSVKVAIEEPAADGKPAKTKTYLAKNAAELKQKHPDAYKYYEKYAGGIAPPPIQVGRAGPPGFAPAGPAGPPQARMIEALKRSRKSLESIRDRLKQTHGPEHPSVKSLEQQLERLDKQQKTYEEQLEQLKKPEQAEQKK